MNYYLRRKRSKFYGRKNRTRTLANLKTDGLGEESQSNHKLVENRKRRPKERKNIRQEYKRQECIRRKVEMEWKVTQGKLPKRPGKK